ncbi:MAG: protein kinase, partial [Clostridia bacterium]|nr:protein kinase [Clostridia bacterium]
MEQIYEKYVGAVLDGRYKIEKIIGMGGMAVVFKAQDTRSGRQVALKLLREDIAQEEESVKRFINESKAVAMLSHPNIVKIYSVSVKEDLKYIVMEYIEGISLKTYMHKKKVLSVDETLNCASQILAALDHAHEKGIVHRDIKPQNIMLTKNGQVKVTDFGIAKLPNAETVTMTDKAIGTVYYISPEQASGKTIDSRSDLYSLGVTMYEMSTGELPFNAESPVSVALMQVNERAVPPKEINPSIPTGLQQIIGCAMEKDPDERYQSAREMLSDVSELRKNNKATFKNGNKKEEKTGFKAVLSQMVHGTTMLPIILGILIPFAIIAAISGVVIINGLAKSGPSVKVNTITVEDFVGKNYTDDDLESYFKKSDLYEATFEEVYDADKPKGTVIEQKPKAGTSKQLSEGEKCQLTLYISTPKKAVEVPDLTVMDLESAKAKLDELGLKYEIINEPNDKDSGENYNEGQIKRIDPAAGEQLESGDTVKIYVCSGYEEEDITVPYVIGENSEQAKDELVEAGFLRSDV